ncbi:hypothetical protein [Streptomyces sp. NPDC005485]|uniref:hypothetical protein n=1 Tax=Streptomyces sp. NPDC005485 TaxID=3155591 RepID=UPI0033A59609
MAKPDADLEGMLLLFCRATEAARAPGRSTPPHVSPRLAGDAPAVSGTAAQGMLTAAGALPAAPFSEVRAELEAIKQPALYVNGLHHVMIPASSSTPRPSPGR